MPNISKKRLLTVEIDLPSLEVQRRYEQRINEVEELRRRARQHLHHVRSLLDSLEHRAFSGIL